jgi:hypothetical protein
VRLAQRIYDIHSYLTCADKAIEFFNLVSPYEAYFILSVLLMPVAACYKDVIPSAPEAVCPFLGVRALDFDVCPVEEGLWAILALSARCGGTVTLFAGALILSACIDLGALG